MCAASTYAAHMAPMTNTTSTTPIDYDYLDSNPAGDELSNITITKTVTAPGSEGEHRVALKLSGQYHAHVLAALQSLGNDEALQRVTQLVRGKHAGMTGVQLALTEITDPAPTHAFDMNLGFAAEEPFSVQVELTAPSLVLGMAGMLHLSLPQNVAMVAHALCVNGTSVQL